MGANEEKSCDAKKLPDADDVKLHFSAFKVKLGKRPLNWNATKNMKDGTVLAPILWNGYKLVSTMILLVSSNACERFVNIFIRNIFL